VRYLVLKVLLFGAKCIAISCKTHCYLVQNALLFAAKRKVKCSKTLF